MSEPQTQSIADLLRQSVENAPEAKPLELALPNFEPTLFMSMRKVKDVHETTAAMDGVDRIKDPAAQAIEMAARLLALSCDHTFVVMDGKRVELPKIGQQLYAQIYPSVSPAPQNDTQAVMALYTGSDGVCDTVALVDAATRYGEWRQGNQEAALEGVLGES